MDRAEDLVQVLMPASGVSRPSVAIIGAGWAGLACALRLARAGYQPTVFESAPEPGGRARRAKLDNTFRDNGQHLMLSGCQALTLLFADLGLKVPRTPFAFTTGQGGLSLAHRPGRIGLILGLLNSGFSWHERWALLRALFSLQLSGWQVPDHQTVTQWLQAHQQPPTLVEHFWQPLALAILNTSMHEAAMTRLAPVLRDTLGRGAEALEILQPTTDLSASVVSPWVNTITAQGGQVLCSQRVTGISVTPDGNQAIKLQHSNDATIFKYVVVAVPPWTLTHIELPFDAPSLADAFGVQPIATVYLGFDESVRLPTPLLQLTGPTPEDARIWAIDRTHCGEPGVIAISLSAKGAWAELDHDTLAKQCLQNLQAALGAPLHCHWHKVVIVHKATPAATPTAWLTSSQRRPRPSLWLAGDWTHPEYPATLEAAVASGFATADEIIATDC